MDQEGLPVWERVLESLQNIVTRPSYETWLKETECIALDQKTIIIGVPNTFVADTLQQRMYSLIYSSLRDILGYEVEAEFVIVATEESPNEVGHITEI